MDELGSDLYLVGVNIVIMGLDMLAAGMASIKNSIATIIQVVIDIKWEEFNGNIRVAVAIINCHCLADYSCYCFSNFTLTEDVLSTLAHMHCHIIHIRDNIVSIFARPITTIVLPAIFRLEIIYLNVVVAMAIAQKSSLNWNQYNYLFDSLSKFIMNLDI